MLTVAPIILFLRMLERVRVGKNCKQRMAYLWSLLEILQERYLQEEPQLISHIKLTIPIPFDHFYQIRKDNSERYVFTWEACSFKEVPFQLAAIRGSNPFFSAKARRKSFRFWMFCQWPFLIRNRAASKYQQQQIVDSKLQFFVYFTLCCLADSQFRECVFKHRGERLII